MTALAMQQGICAGVRAIVIPACTCRHAAASHPDGGACRSCSCQAYVASRRAEYRLSLSVARWKRSVCSALWSIARRADEWRVALEGSR